jgi:predicted nucleotidyltransferase component of viral defense system
MSVLSEMIDRQKPSNDAEWLAAMRETMQIIALAGLYRGGFFDKAAFYGGTCLRIFHKLDRFSEDMDFSLLKPNSEFTLEPWFDAIKLEFKAAGADISIERKIKSKERDIDSVFLKPDTKEYALRLNQDKKLKIKIEVDKNPPLKFQVENNLLLQPFSFFVKTYTLSSLFAGKLHALLYRSWKNRVKGRDWYDFEWYIRNGVALNLDHFNARAIQSGHIHSGVDKTGLFDLLQNKIVKLDVKAAKEDVSPFLKTTDQLNIWSKEYFLELSKALVII